MLLLIHYRQTYYNKHSNGSSKSNSNTSTTLCERMLDADESIGFGGRTVKTRAVSKLFFFLEFFLIYNHT